MDNNKRKSQKIKERMISILSVNYNGIDWVKLLINSVRKFTTVPYEIIIVDNASEDGSVEWLAAQEDLLNIFLTENIGHGRGLDLAFKKATFNFCLILDIDSHIQRKGWHTDLMRLYEKEEKTRLIAAGGMKTKIIHPCFMFFERRFFIENGFSFTAKELDVGRKIYYDIIDLGYETLRIFSNYENEKKEKFYKGAWGDEYYIEDKPTIYHNWYGTRMWGRNENEIDGFKRTDLEKCKELLFNQPLVKEILE